MASDQDLKLADTLRYYMRDSQAAKALLIRRLRCLANYENANRNLEKARQKNKDIHAVSIFTSIDFNKLFNYMSFVLKGARSSRGKISVPNLICRHLKCVCVDKCFKLFRRLRYI